MTEFKYYKFIHIINYPTRFDLNILNPKGATVTICSSLIDHYSN